MSKLGRVPKTLVLLSILTASALSAQVPTFKAPAISCPFSGFANAPTSRAISVANYQGSNLSEVTLFYRASLTRQYSIALTAHRNTVEGPSLGTQTRIVGLGVTGVTPVTFNFGGAKVEPGTTIAFTQEVSSSADAEAQVYFDEGFAGSRLDNCAQMSGGGVAILMSQSKDAAPGC
jgi:hypothetical protein